MLSIESSTTNQLISKMLPSELQHVIHHHRWNSQYAMCPDVEPSETDINQLLSQFSPPLILLVDFNTHNPIWGSYKTNKKGYLLEQVLQTTDLILLMNDGQPTYFLTATSIFSAIDLLLVSSSISHHLT